MNKKVTVVATKQFEQGVKMLKKMHDNEAIQELYEVVTKLRNLEITTQNKNHWLKNADGHRDIHIKGGNYILMYKYIGGDDYDDISLVITLRLQDLVDHKELRRYDSKKYKLPAKEYDIETIKSSESINQIPSILEDKLLGFTLAGANNTWNDDILLIAENHGAIRVKYDTVNPQTGRFWSISYWQYACPSLEIAQNILDGCKEQHIPLRDNQITNVHPINWSDCYNIRIDDYEKGIYKLNYNKKGR